MNFLGEDPKMADVDAPKYQKVDLTRKDTELDRALSRGSSGMIKAPTATVDVPLEEKDETAIAKRTPTKLRNNLHGHRL